MPITIFCWLPPERNCASWSPSGVAIRSRAISRAASASAWSAPDTSARKRAPQAGQQQVVPHRADQRQPFGLAAFRDQRGAQFAGAVRPPASRWPKILISPCRIADAAPNTARAAAAPRSHQPRQPDDLAGAHLQVDLRDTAVRADVAHIERHLAGCAPRSRL
ncbi:hypothetical protein ACU4GD_22475 [Cupriavidus basilensis]